jgi:hypothetical protein
VGLNHGNYSVGLLRKSSGIYKRLPMSHI